MSSSSSSNKSTISKPKPTNGERYNLQSETELRLEIPDQTTIIITLLVGSAEIFGSELTLLTDSTTNTTTNTSGLGMGMGSDATKQQNLSKQSHVITGPAKFAIFTWHGCTIDIDVEFGKELGISYTSDETVCNVAYVNTHAQLEAMRDEALGSYLDPNARKSAGSGSAGNSSCEPPRVLVVGANDSGKTSLVKVLTSYGESLSLVT